MGRQPQRVPPRLAGVPVAQGPSLDLAAIRGWVNQGIEESGLAQSVALRCATSPVPEGLPIESIPQDAANFKLTRIP